jgi:hypothetical protein
VATISHQNHTNSRHFLRAIIQSLYDFENCHFSSSCKKASKILVRHGSYRNHTKFSAFCMMDSLSYLAHKQGKNDAKTTTKQGLLLGVHHT